jgi:hypothetical protein
VGGKHIYTGAHVIVSVRAFGKGKGGVFLCIEKLTRGHTYATYLKHDYGITTTQSVPDPPSTDSNLSLNFARARLPNTIPFSPPD